MAYNGNYHIHKDSGLTESQDQVAKGNVEISKVVSSSGQSNGLELEGAGFTFYLVSDLSKVEQFDQTRTGNYTLQSILDAYINKEYDNEHPKWDFSGETQAIAKTYEVNADEIAAYNRTLTAAGDNKNGKGDGWQPTGRANEYQLAEIFSNDSGNIRVQGLSYGTYGIAGYVGSGQVNTKVDIENATSALPGGIGNMPVAMELMVVSWMLRLVNIVINTIVAARFIELYVYNALASLPIATLCYRELHGIAVNFLKNYMAVALQGAVLYLVIGFYPALTASLGSGGDITEQAWAR